MFKNLFGKKDSKSSEKEIKKPLNVDWIPLQSLEQLNAVIKASNEVYVAIFKHSTRCSISKTVAERFEKNYPSGLNLKLYYLDLLNYRDVSNEIAQRFQVIHQSPQFILLKDGQAVLNASHYDILEVNLTEVVK